ncbi:MAG: Crp/Fnr family transcriptional regulator [Actinomycetota bacterium]|nr:Crp/Fnr family transcriptional regulator [Actinomycetota bacterium]
MGRLLGAVQTEGRRFGAASGSGEGGFSLAVADLAEAGVGLRDQTYPGGAVIFRRGEVPAWVYLLCSGVVELSRHGPGHRVAVDVVRCGGLFGDVPLLSGSREPFDAQVLEESHVLSIPSGEFLRALRRRSELAEFWLKSLAVRASHLQQRLLDALPGEVDHRLARLLLAQNRGGQVALSQAVMAELLGVHRASISRVLHAFKAAGLVELGYRKVGLLDAEGLRRVAGLAGEPTDEVAPPSTPPLPAPGQADRNLPRLQPPRDRRLPQACTARRRGALERSTRPRPGVAP